MDKAGYDAFGSVQLAIRLAIGAAMAAAIAQAMKLDFPIFALLAAIIATDLTFVQSRYLGLRRLIATLLGALFGTIMSAILAPSAWSAGFGILLTLFVSQRLNARSGAKLASYVCAIIMLHYGATSLSYAFYRLVETALGVLVAWLIALVPLLFANERVETRRREEDSLNIPWFRIDHQPTAPEPVALILDVQLAVRTAAAATLAILCSQALMLDYPILAGIAAVIATDLSPATSRALGISRVATTIIGATCGGLMGLALDSNPWWSGAGVLITMLACQLVGLSAAAKVAACACAIVMAMHDGQPIPFAFERVIETIIGVAAAWGVSCVPKLIPVKPTA